MYLAGPQSRVGGWLAEHGGDGKPPYWAYLWAGGAVLARYVLDHPEVVRRRRVLDFGAGCGVVGIAAALAGAAAVQASETDANGRVALTLNAAANGVAVGVLDDFRDEVDADIILAGDVFYLEEVADAVLPALERWAASGKTVLVGDPFRRPLPLDRLRLVHEVRVPDFGVTGLVRAGVFTLRQPSDGTPAEEQTFHHDTAQETKMKPTDDKAGNKGGNGEKTAPEMPADDKAGTGMGRPIDDNQDDLGRDINDGSKGKDRRGEA